MLLPKIWLLIQIPPLSLKSKRWDENSLQETANSARHSSKQFIGMNSFNPHNQHNWHYLLWSTFYRWRHWDIQRCLGHKVSMHSANIHNQLIGCQDHSTLLSLYIASWAVKVINILREDVATGSVAIHLSFVRKVAKSAMGSKWRSEIFQGRKWIEK